MAGSGSRGATRAVSGQPGRVRDQGAKRMRGERGQGPGHKGAARLT